MIRFSAPWMLVVGLPLLLWVVFRLRRLPVEHAGLRRLSIQALMGLSALAAVLALAGLEIGSQIDRVAVVFAVDRSRSVDHSVGEGSTEALRRIRESFDAMEPDDRAGLVVFGATAATEVIPSPSPSFGALGASVTRDATDIGAAIRMALADLPAEHSGRIVLVSDGVETQGDALAAAASAASRGVVVDVVPIERAPRPEVAVDRVRLSATADPGEPLELRIVTRATDRTEVDVRVTRGGEVLASTRTVISAGDDVLIMRDIAPEAGVHRYDVLLEPVDPAADLSRENNEGGAFVRVLGGSKALVLADDPERAQALAAAIEGSGLSVDLAGPRRVPADLASLAAYDVLVLSDLNARGLTEAQMGIVSSYVRDMGGGLLMLGARDSFGLGGYAYTPVEEVLPATFDLRQRRDRASLAMVIGIDNSGSMGAEASAGRTKLDLANEAAARSAKLLSPFDRVGVIHVDTAVGWTLPMTAVTNPDQVAAAIRRAQPGGGGILVDVAMHAAYRALGAETTQLKHFLLFSDGEDSQNLQGTRRLVQDALRDRITTTIVSMGAGMYTPELEQLSRLGEGRFYIVEDMGELPRIFTQETIEASRSAIVEEAFQPVALSPGAAIRGIDFGSSPALRGYVAVNARRAATVLLAAKDDDPLLLQWNHGVGRSAVFATDGGADLGRSWLSWAGYAALFGQLARDIARSPERRDARVSLTVRDGVGTVRVEAVDEGGRYRNYLTLDGTVAAPGGRRVEVPMAQTGAGRYEGTFDAEAPGPYLATVREAEQGMVGSAGTVRPSGDELRGEGTDHGRLSQIAALTGGVRRDDLRAVFTDRPPPTWAHRPLWQTLVMGALCCMLLSVALRRLILPRGLMARLLPRRLRRWLGGGLSAPAVATVNPEATLEALGAAHDRAKERLGQGQVAPEVRAAMAAKAASRVDAGPAAPPVTDDRGPAADPTGGDPASPKVSPPAESLAEQLLSRKKNR